MDTTIIKIDSAFSPKGKQGEKYLAMGKKIAMRLWEKEQPMQQPKVRVGFSSRS